MKTQSLAITIFSAAVALHVHGGTISGTVHAEGKAGAEAETAGGAYDSRKYKFAERVNYAEMRDFIIYIDSPLSSKPAPPEKPVQVVTTKKISQHGAMFTPHVLPIMAGTTVEWPNNDDILHNVFSVSESNPFDLGLYKAPEVKSWKFDKPGRVDVFCSIHTSMSCIVLVLENPYFTTSDGKNHYSLLNVPAGTYKLKAWHERLPSQVKEITVPEAGEVKADFVLGITHLPQP